MFCRVDENNLAAPNWVQTSGFRGRSWSLETALTLEETPSVLPREHVEVLDGSDCKEMGNAVHTDGPESSHISATERNSSSQLAPFPQSSAAVSKLLVVVLVWDGPVQ